VTLTSSLKNNLGWFFIKPCWRLILSLFVASLRMLISREGTLWPLVKMSVQKSKTIHFLEGPPHDKYWLFILYLFFHERVKPRMGRKGKGWKNSFNESGWKFEAITGLWCPIDVQGRTRNTLMKSTSLYILRQDCWRECGSFSQGSGLHFFWWFCWWALTERFGQSGWQTSSCWG